VSTVFSQSVIHTGYNVHCTTQTDRRRKENVKVSVHVLLHPKYTTVGIISSYEMNV